MTAYIDRATYHPNRKDYRPRPSKRDDSRAWLAAGFEMIDWNKFRFVIKNRTYRIAPGGGGLRVTGRTINGEGLIFPYGHPPAKIAAYLENLADNPAGEY